MSRRWYVDSSPSGRQQYVTVKRSHSYGGNHHHVRDVDYIKVKLDEWNGLVDKERKLQDMNKDVVDECNALKSTLSASQAESKRLSTVTIPKLEKQIAVLSADVEALRRTGDNSSKFHREEDRLLHKVAKLEKENSHLRDDKADLLERNRCLSRQLEQSPGRRASELVGGADHWKHQSRSWRSRYEGLLKRYDDLCDIIETRTKKLKAYEDILQRLGII